jgi:hypothetical protein
VNADLLGRLRDGRWVQPTSAAGVLGIGAAAFLLSYDALHSLAWPAASALGWPASGPESWTASSWSPP